MVENQEVEVQNQETPAVMDGNAQTSEWRLRRLCDALDEHKAREVVVLDVRSQTLIADFFVVCCGTSSTHIRSIAEGVREKLRDGARMRAKPEGDIDSTWIVLDYGDVILHVFDEGTREFYDLERLWADAEVVPWPQTDENGAGGTESSSATETGAATAETGAPTTETGTAATEAGATTAEAGADTAV